MYSPNQLVKIRPTWFTNGLDTLDRSEKVPPFLNRMALIWDIVEDLVSRWKRQMGISNVVKVERMLQPTRANTFLSAIFHFRADLILTSGQKVTKYFIIKSLPTNELKRKNISDFGYFLKEIMVYRDLIPVMEKIKTENGDLTEPLWCNCFDCVPYERVVLEDLSDAGYELCRDLNVDHAYMVVEGLAKFHALSVALNEQQRIPLDVFGERTFEKHQAKLSRQHQVMFEDFLDFSEVHWGKEWLPLLSKLEKYVAGNITELIWERIENPDNTFAVLNHGDLWKNNLLFMYEGDSNEPTSVKFIDFQKAGFRSPAFDLQYFFSTTTNIELRKNYKQIIRAYHSSLVIYMKQMGCLSIPLTLKQLLKEVRDLQIFGVFIAVTVLPTLLDEGKSLTKKNNRDETLTHLYGGEAYINFMQYLLGKFENNEFNKDL